MKTTIRQLSYYLLFAGSLFILTMVLHEMGHALAAKLLHYNDHHVYVWPGVEIYPEPGSPYPGLWYDKSVARTTVQRAGLSRNAERLRRDLLQAVNLQDRPFIEPQYYPNLVQKTNVAWWQIYSAQALDREMAERERESRRYAIIKLMGSAFTLLISVFGTAALIWLKPTGLWLHCSRLVALLHWDVLTYAIFPYFFNAPHLLFFGGTGAEPLEALEYLGVATEVSVISISCVSLALSVIFIGTLRSTRSNTHTNKTAYLLNV